MSEITAASPSIIFYAVGQTLYSGFFSTIMQITSI
ncbi:MAG: hypothetical protein IKD59_08440 [Lachnospiraceae bacterium]|nr:hypothetical protein [Lachnospiraceae bacterium]MBR3171189.1 hypothetical protein [Lachnospiraceae bacterium]